MANRALLPLIRKKDVRHPVTVGSYLMIMTQNNPKMKPTQQRWQRNRTAVLFKLYLNATSSLDLPVSRGPKFAGSHIQIPYSIEHTLRLHQHIRRRSHCWLTTSLQTTRISEPISAYSCRSNLSYSIIIRLSSSNPNARLHISHD